MLLLLSLLLFCSASQGKDYTIIVETSSSDKAGTDANIFIKISGTKYNTRSTDITKKGSYETGSVDKFLIQDYDIGHVTGMQIYRDESGFFANWKLDKITIKIAGNVDSIFNYYGWVRANKWITLPLSCPSAVHVNNQGYCGDPAVSADYTIIVETSSSDKASTDANIHIRVSGTKGNIAATDITKKGSYETGSVDTIHIKEGDIGHVTGMEIHRDEAGFFPNWKLDKVTIKIAGNVDSIFNYYGWVRANKWITLPLSCPSADHIHVNNQGYCDVVE